MVDSVWRCLDLLAHTRRIASGVPTLRASVHREDAWVQADLLDVQAIGIASLAYADLQTSVSVSVLGSRGHHSDSL